MFCDPCIESSDAEHENSWETQLNVTGTLSWHQYQTVKILIIAISFLCKIPYVMGHKKDLSLVKGQKCRTRLLSTLRVYTDKGDVLPYYGLYEKAFARHLNKAFNRESSLLCHICTEVEHQCFWSHPRVLRHSIVSY